MSLVRVNTILFCLGLIFTSAVASASNLETLIYQRLTLMKNVAAWKFENDIPVENLEREKVVLKAALDKSTSSGIDPRLIENFFIAQIEAAKAIQRCWISRWLHSEDFDTSLVKIPLYEVRVRLLEISDDMLEVIKQSRGQQAQIDIMNSVDCLDNMYMQSIKTSVNTLFENRSN